MAETVQGWRIEALQMASDDELIKELASRCDALVLACERRGVNVEYQGHRQPQVVFGFRQFGSVPTCIGLLRLAAHNLLHDQTVKLGPENLG